jgi:hypothetical protein
MAANSSLSPHLLTVIVVRDGMALCSFNVGVPGAEYIRSDWFRLETLKPVEDDPATLGALLAEVQRVWGFDDLHPRQPAKGAATGASLTDDQRTIAASLNLDADAYAAALAAQG